MQIVFGLMLVLLGPSAMATGAESGSKRLALIIGNGSYPTSPLAASVNDAGLMSQTLAQAGFDVTAAANTNIVAMRKLFSTFAAKVQSSGPDSVAFVYLAGYGLQYDGDNFFVPVDAKISRDIDVSSQAVNLSELSTALKALPARARIFVYDLARAKPFSEAGLPLASGLTITASPDGSLTAINAAPGNIAEPDLVPYGTYARALAEAIQTPGLPAGALFTQVRLRVAERTNGGQIPFNAGSVDFTFYPKASGLRAAAPDVAITSGGSIAEAFITCVRRDSMSAFNEFVRAFPNDPLTARIRRMNAIRREVLIWNESLQANTARAYWTYMRRYPRGPHFGDARRKLAELNAALEPPPRFEIYDYFDLPPPTADELTILGKRNIGVAETASVPIPPVPISFLPPIRAAFYDDLPPPPISPENVLPIPTPIALPTGVESAGGFGAIVQAEVPGFGVVTAETRGATVVVKAGDKLISQTSALIDHGARALLQTGDHGEVISRTLTTYDKGAVLMVQRGPDGRVLMEIASRDGSDGTRTTTTLNGQGQLIGRLRAGSAGEVKTIEIGSVPVGEQISLLIPSAAFPSLPQVVSLAQLQAKRGLAQKEQVAAEPRPAPSSPPMLSTPSSDAVSASAKIAPVQSSTMSHPASPELSMPKPAQPVQSDSSPKPMPAGVPSSSPTGGATLAAIPPMLRQSASALVKAAPSTSPDTAVPSARSLPDIAPAQGDGGPPPQSSRAKVETPSAPAASSLIPHEPPTIGLVPVAPQPAPMMPPQPTAPALSSSTASPSSPADAADGPPKPPASVVTGSPSPSTAEVGLAPTDAPPSRSGPPSIEAEMLMPSRNLPAVFQPPAPTRQTTPRAAAAQSPAQSPPAQPPGLVPPSEAATVAPPLPPSRPGTEASGPSGETPQQDLPTAAALPVDPPLPPRRPAPPNVKKRTAVKITRSSASTRPDVRSAR